MLYEAIIVGAGPSGLATALSLLHSRTELAGKVLVLEKKAFPREKPCAGALGARGDRVLEGMGLRVRVPEVPLTGIRVTVPQGSSQWFPGRIGRVVRRLEFDASLAGLSRERGVHLLEDTPLKDFLVTPSHVEAVTPSGTFRGRVLVGADGVGSLVRRRLGLPFGSLKARAVEVETERVPADPPENTLHFDVSDREISGYAWDFPTPREGGVAMTRGIYALQLPGDPAPELRERLNRRLERLGLATGGLRVRSMAERGFDPHHPFSRRRVLLVGEAAGVDPLTGEGIAEALQYGALAGRYLARKLALGALELDDWRTTFYRSPLGVDLFLRRWGAYLCFRYARRPAELLFAWSPRLLRRATELFAGRFPPGRERPNPASPGPEGAPPPPTGRT